MIVDLLPGMLLGLGLLAFAALIVALLRWRCAPVLLAESDAAVAVSAAVISVYGLILGLTLAAAWERYRHAEEALTSELNAIFVLHRMAGNWPDERGEALRSALIDYGHVVRDQELTHEPAHRFTAPAGAGAMRDIYAALTAATSGSGGEVAASSAAWDRLADLDYARGARLNLTRSGLPPFFWVVIYAGCAVSLAALAVIHPADRRVHLALSLAASLVIVLAVILLRDLDSPLAGASTVDFQAFARGIDFLEASGP